jgi:hypothetical protein
MRKIKLTWEDLRQILKNQPNHNQLLSEETIAEITLVKPKTLLIYISRPIDNE